MLGMLALPVIKLIAGKIFDLFGLETKLQMTREEYLAKIETAKFEALPEIMSAFFGMSKELISNEQKGEDWLQRNWRPVVALTAFFSYIFVVIWYPFFAAWGVLPQVTFGEVGVANIWDMAIVCVAGYGGVRTIEKIFGKS